MSVLRSKRQVAKTEYENTFANLYKFSYERTVAIPKRRKKWLANNIDTTMNRVYRNIMAINEHYNRDESCKNSHTCEIAEMCIENLLSLEKPLMIMWNVQESEMRVMAPWVEQINYEIFLLNHMCMCEVSYPKVAVLDWRAINSAQFLKNMSELHRYTHGKVTNACMDYDNTQGALFYFNLMQYSERVMTEWSEMLVTELKLLTALLKSDKKRFGSLQ